MRKKRPCLGMQKMHGLTRGACHGFEYEYHLREGLALLLVPLCLVARSLTFLSCRAWPCFGVCSCDRFTLNSGLFCFVPASSWGPRHCCRKQHSHSLSCPLAAKTRTRSISTRGNRPPRIISAFSILDSICSENRVSPCPRQRLGTRSFRLVPQQQTATQHHRQRKSSDSKLLARPGPSEAP